MKYDFSKLVDRRNTSCLKYDFAVRRGRPADVLPLWVADMDFCAPPQVQEALKRTVQHGIFGYTESGDSYFAAVADWFEQYHGWRPQREWLVKTPGVVFALAAAVRAFTKPGEAVLVQQPVYYPFSEVVTDNNRVLVNSPLVLKNGHYEIDFADFERKIVENKVKLFLLCSPHNPVGRVWSQAELLQIGSICAKHHVLVAADEIHADFVWPGYRHHSFLTVSPQFAQFTILCTSPSKTFNLAGLQASNIFLPNTALRRAFRHEVAAAGYSQLNVMGLIGCEAAYRGGAEWLQELRLYLWDNIAYVRSFLRNKLPQIQLIEPEGTYLLWLDCRGLGLTTEQLENFIVQQARLWLDSGAAFGKAGEGFQRINVACPRATLQQAMEQLYRAAQALPILRKS